MNRHNHNAQAARNDVKESGWFKPTKNRAKSRRWSKCRANRLERRAGKCDLD